MTFKSAKCEVCSQYRFDPGEVVAYRVRAGAITFIDLGGQEPWSGVRCICKACISAMKEAPR